MKVKYLCSTLVMLLLFIGCSTRLTPYKRDRIIRNFLHYQVYLNNEKLISLDTFYLNKNNVDKVTVSNKNRTLNIIQKDKNKVFTSLAEITRSIQKETEDIDTLLTIIDGVIIYNTLNKIQIENGSIKEIIRLKKEDVLCHLPHAKSGLILITTHNK